MYGGFICVFNRPNSGDFEPAMIGLHWSQVVLFLSFSTMVTHVVWFIPFGRLSFPNMPCATTVFFFGSIKNEWMDVLDNILVSYISFVVILATLWICGFCFVIAVKILASIVELLLYRDLFPRVGYRSVVQLQSAIPRYLRFRSYSSG